MTTITITITLEDASLLLHKLESVKKEITKSIFKILEEEVVSGEYDVILKTDDPKSDKNTGRSKINF